MSVNLWEESDSENELPAGWLERIEPDGYVFFVNSTNDRISYTDPRLATSSIDVRPKGLLNGQQKPRFDRFSTVDDVLRGKDLRGRVYVIAGSCCGLIRCMALRLISHGATVVIACAQLPSQAEPLLSFTPRSHLSAGRLFWIPCDPTRLSSVTGFVMTFKSMGWPIHVLILAFDRFPPGKSSRIVDRITRLWTDSFGRFWAKLSLLSFLPSRVIQWIRNVRFPRPLQCDCIPERVNSTGLTEDGFEVAMQTNYLAPVLLLQSLRPLLSNQPNDSMGDSIERPRVVWLSGESHRHVCPQWIKHHTVYRVDPFRSVPSSFIDRLQHYALIKLLQLNFLSEFPNLQRAWNPSQQSRDSVHSDSDQNMQQLPLLCACNGEPVMAVRCLGTLWWCITQGLFDPMLALFRLVRIPFLPFTQSLVQAAATPSFCATDAGLPFWNIRKSRSKQSHLLCLDGCRRTDWSPLDDRFGLRETVIDCTQPITFTLKMDPSLLKERASFLERAKAQPVIERPRPAPVAEPTAPTSLRRVPGSAPSDLRSLEHTRPQMQGRFAVLSKVVKYMKALPNNPKIRITSDGKFLFRPRFDLRNRQDLYQLLKRYEAKGLGGLYMDDLVESIPDAEKVLNGFGDHVIRIHSSHDKKTIVFFNDKSFDLKVEDEFKQQWRGVSVEGVHESKIEEYLRRNGISSMSGDSKKFIPAQRKRPGQRRPINKPFKLKDNEHVGDIIEDFSEKLNK